ncbi:MAG: hypothetical protein ABIL49_02540 [candidate division WOR-3 bacterium]
MFIFFVFLLLFVGCQKIEGPSVEFGKFFGAITLKPDSSFYIGGFLNEGDTIDIGFRTLNSTISKFFIADEENFNKWQNNQPAQFLISYDNINEIDLKYPIAQSQKYYVVIVNSPQKQKVFIRIKKL